MGVLTERRLIEFVSHVTEGFLALSVLTEPKLIEFVSHVTEGFHTGVTVAWEGGSSDTLPAFREQVFIRA